MKFGITYNSAHLGTDPARIASFARRAEDAGFESFYVPEHLVLYPGASVGSFELPPALPVADPVDLLAFVAATTERILLGTAVLVLPYHHPIMLAKRLATVDLLSRGRLRLLTVGLGALPGEARAMGVDYAARGRLADEAIDVMRLLWTGGADGVSFHGEFFDFDDVCVFPKPYGGASLPIHIGGSSRAAARRARDRGDGFFPGGSMPGAERAAQRQIAGDLEYTRWGSAELTADRVEDLAAQGVTRIVVSPADEEELEAFARRFV